MSELDEFLARMSAMEYLVRVMMLNELMAQPDPLETAQSIRERMLDRMRYRGRLPPGTNPDEGLAAQARALSALERWFDALESDIQGAMER